MINNAINPEKIKQLKTDFMLLNELSNPGYKTHINGPLNINQLVNVLKSKNFKARQQITQRQMITQRLKQEQRIDIYKIKQQLKKAKEINMKKQQIKKIQEDCHFYVSDLSYKNLDVYLNKAKQFGILTSISKTMKKTDLTQRIIKKNQQKLSKIGSINNNYPIKQIGIVKEIRTQIRNQQNQKKYISAISSLARGQIDKNDIVTVLSNKINKKFWKIFAKHVQCLNLQRPYQDQRNSFLCIESLKLVQDQYKQIISKRANSLNDYLRSYLKSDKDKIIRDGQHQSFWGKVFILYRAGKIKQVNNLLHTENQNQLKIYITKTQDSISKKRPICIRDIQTTNQTDMFKDQIIHMLRGQTKYTSDTLVSNQSIDIVWFILRGAGIFTQKIQQFNNIRFEALRYFKVNDTYLNKSILQNYLYLLSYNKIALMGPSQMMDQDDYLHFLLCLSLYEDLINNKQDNQDKLNSQELQNKSIKQRIQQIFKRQLVNFIKELINKGQTQYIYYMRFIPRNYRISEISTILASSDLIQKVNWVFFQNILPSQQEYKNLVKQTLNKFLASKHDNILAAKYYSDILNENEESVKLLLEELMKAQMNNHLCSYEVQTIQKDCQSYIYGRQNLHYKYTSTLNFLKNYRLLNQIIQKKNYQSLREFIMNNPFIILTSTYSNDTYQILENLNQISKQGLDVYLNYVNTILKNLQLFSKSNHNRQSIFEDLAIKIKNGIIFIFNMESFSKFKNRHTYKQLIKYLESL